MSSAIVCCNVVPYECLVISGVHTHTHTHTCSPVAQLCVIVELTLIVVCVCMAGRAGMQNTAEFMCDSLFICVSALLLVVCFMAYLTKIKMHVHAEQHASLCSWSRVQRYRCLCAL